MRNIKEALELLEQGIGKAKEQAELIVSVLREEKIPSLEALESLVLSLKDVGDTEVDIQKQLFSLGNIDVSKVERSLGGYRLAYEKMHKVDKERLEWQIRLEKFGRVVSEDKRYDEALRAFRVKAGKLLESLGSSGKKVKKEEVEGFLTFLEILEREHIGSEDPLFDRVMKFVSLVPGEASMLVFRGLVLGKYYIQEIESPPPKGKKPSRKKAKDPSPEEPAAAPPEPPEKKQKSRGKKTGENSAAQEKRGAEPPLKAAAAEKSAADVPSAEPLPAKRGARKSPGTSQSAAKAPAVKSRRGASGETAPQETPAKTPAVKSRRGVSGETAPQEPPAKTPAVKPKGTVAGIIYPVEDKDVRMALGKFRGHLERLAAARPADILAWGIGFIYFTSPDMVRLFSFLGGEIPQEDDLLRGLQGLCDKGYLASFRIGGEESVHFFVREAARNSLLSANFEKHLLSLASIPRIDMKGFTPAPLASLQPEEVYALERRNRAFLDAAIYIRKKLGDEFFQSRFLGTLSCSISFYCIEDPPIALGSAAMFPGTGVGQEEAVDWLRKHPQYSLVISDSAANPDFPARWTALELPNPWMSLKAYRKLLQTQPPRKEPSPARAPASSKERSELPLFDAVEEVPPQEPEMPALEGPVLELPSETLSEAAAASEDSIDSVDSIDSIEGTARILQDLDPGDEQFHQTCNLLLEKLLDAPMTGEEEAPDRIAQGVVFLQALRICKFPGEPGESYEKLSQKLQLAADLRIDALSYESTTLSTIFPDDSDLSLKLPAWLRGMFAPDQWDYDLYALGEELLIQEDFFSNQSPKLRELTAELVKLKRTTEGFSDPVLRAIADQGNKQRRAKQLAEQALLLQKGPTIQARLNGSREFTRLCFGPKSDLLGAMEIIEKGDLSGRDRVTALIEELKDNASIDDFIQRKWGQVSRELNLRVLNLENAARKQTHSYIQKQVDLMKEWLVFTQKNTLHLGEEILSIRTRLLEMLPQAIESVRAEERPGAALLLPVFRSMQEALTNGVAPKARLRFVEFLHSPWICLDEEGMPILAPPEEKQRGLFTSLPGMESWRMALRHIASEPRLSLGQVLERIKTRDESVYRDNFGSYQQIENYLEEQKGIEPGPRFWELENSRRAIEDFNQDRENDLKASLELAFWYGQIGAYEKEHLLSLEEQFKVFYWERLNYGNFRFALSLLGKEMEKQRRILGERLQARFDGILERADRDCPLARDIEHLLKNGRFAAAEEYLHQLASGETNLPKLPEEEDSFGDFLKDWDRLNHLCQSKRGIPLGNWAQDMLNPEWPRQRQMSSLRLLENWPRGKSVGEGEIKNFFEELGFTVEGANRIRTEPYLIFGLHAKKTDPYLREPPHPIAAFGTRMPDPIQVICLFGSYAVKELKDIIVQQTQVGNLSIVLYEDVSSLRERRELVASFHRTNESCGFLLIDQVLALFLASLDKGERMAALLKCSLPWTFYQPFSNGAGPIPEEMFFGRKQELDEILRIEGGGTLLYGGGQVGKTALLLRARGIFHRPAKKEFGVYLEVLNKKPEDILHTLCLEMKSSGVELGVAGLNSWEDLCGRIRTLFEKGRMSKLLLLLDGTDKFFEAEGERGFPILHLLFDMMHLSQNQFKVVFAGLHNTARSKAVLENKTNEGVSPLPKPLCLRPFSTWEAGNFLRRSLSYLGFNLQQLEGLEHVLTNTNFYPGVLHFFGNILIKTLLSGEDYGQYYQASENPPYRLDDAILRRIFGDERFNRRIQEKIDSILAQDLRYKILANVLADLYYSRTTGQEEEGYRVEEIITHTEIHRITDLSQEEVKALLSEMVDMGILWTDEKENRFRFRRDSFVGVLGTPEGVLEFLIEQED